MIKVEIIKVFPNSGLGFYNLEDQMNDFFNGKKKRKKFELIDIKYIISVDYYSAMIIYKQ